MKLTIITINFNNIFGLQKTIESVKSQTYKNFEWIIIDGNSSDGSKKLIENNAIYFDYWVSEPDSGIYNAMNKGISHATGDYLLFLNSGDCFFSKETIQKIIPYLNGKDIYVGYEISKYGRRGLEKNTHKYMTNLLIKTSLPHQATILKLDVFKNYGGYDEKIYLISDWWFTFLRILIDKVSIEKINENICFYDTNGLSKIYRTQVEAERRRLLLSIKLPPRIFGLVIIHELLSRIKRIIIFLFFEKS